MRWLPMLSWGAATLATREGEQEGIFVQIDWLGRALVLNIYGRAA